MLYKPVFNEENKYKFDLSLKLRRSKLYSKNMSVMAPRV